MNVLTGNIADITVHGNLSLVHLTVGAITLSTIVIESPGSAKYLRKGNTVRALFKETEVILGRPGPLEVSLQNRIPCIIENIERGSLLSRVSLLFENTSLVSVITSKAVEQLNLAEGDDVIAMIKTNEIMLSE